MLKNVLLVAFLLVLFNAIFIFSGGLELLVKTEQEEEQKTIKINPDIVDVFRFTLEDEVKKKIGQPVEGYEPQMFLTAFPGLVETDFNGVDASIGHYEIIDGRLQHINDEKGPVHSAAGAITRRGMVTLLDNVAKRAGIDLQADGTITDIVSVITAN